MNATVPDTIQELRWHADQARESRFHIMQDEARARKEATQEFLSAYTFTRADSECLVSAGGMIVRMGMVVEERATGRRAVVVCSLEYGKQEWYAMTPCTLPVAEAIRIVQERIESNRQAQA
jgi:hypothetical protein